MPGVGGGDDEGDGEGDGDGDGGGDGGGEDRVGADERGASGDVLWPAVGPSVGDVAVLGDPDAGVGLRPGEDCAPAWLDAAIDGAADVPKLPPPRATVEARARCVPPAISSTAIPPATTATATAATPAAARGRRRTSCHHRGPGGMIGFGNPVRPNAPARCVTLTRSARPVGVLSAPACSTRSRRASGGLTSRHRALRGQPSGVGQGGRASPAASPAAPSRRRHSFRATACSQEPSWSGSRSPSSLAVAMVKVSATASAASPGGCGSGSMDRQ